MPDWIWIKAALKAVLLPPAGLLLLAIAGLLLLRRRPRTGRCLAWLGVGSLAVLSLPFVGASLLRAVSATAPLDLVAARDAQAIVVLGGGVRRDTLEYGGDTLGRLTLERVRYGAHVARSLGLPVLVTGGSVLGGTEEAALMRHALEREFGVQVRWAEPRSRDTRENAQYSAPLLRDAGVTRIVLVAHAVDMPRAQALFAETGLAVVPAPIAIPAWNSRTWLDWLPSLSGLQDSYYAIYEGLGNAVRLTAATVRTDR